MVFCDTGSSWTNALHGAHAPRAICGQRLWLRSLGKIEIASTYLLLDRVDEISAVLIR